MNGQQSTAGIGFGGGLTLLFVGLKLAGIINWSWLWVLAPIWIPTLICLLILVFFAGWWLWLSVADNRDRERRRARTGGIAPHEHGPARRWGGRE